LRKSHDLVAALLEKSLAGGFTCCLQPSFEAAKSQSEPADFVRRLARVEGIFERTSSDRLDETGAFRGICF
jgi:hypothetical protein